MKQANPKKPKANVFSDKQMLTHSGVGGGVKDLWIMQSGGKEWGSKDGECDRRYCLIYMYEKSFKLKKASAG